MKEDIRKKLDAIFLSPDKSVHKALKKIPLVGDKQGENLKYMAFYIVEHPQYARDFIHAFRDVLVHQRSDIFASVLIQQSDPVIRHAIRESGILGDFSQKARSMHEASLAKKDMQDVLLQIENPAMRNFISTKISSSTGLNLPSLNEMNQFVTDINSLMKTQKGVPTYLEFRQCLDKFSPQLTSRFEVGREEKTEFEQKITNNSQPQIVMGKKPTLKRGGIN